MANSRWLLDTNILFRWVKPDDRDYQLVTSAFVTRPKCRRVLEHVYSSFGSQWLWTCPQGSRPSCTKFLVADFYCVLICSESAGVLALYFSYATSDVGFASRVICVFDRFRV